MYHLLLLEWKKQKDYVLFKILLLAYIVLLPGALMIGKKIPGSTAEGMPFNPQTLFFNFPTVWSWLAYAGNWVVFFVLGFLGVLAITNEYTYRTLRQNIITGLHRRAFYMSKLYFMVAISLVFTAYYALCAIIIGSFHADPFYIKTLFVNMGVVPRYFLMCIGYMSFGLLVGILVKRTGIALFVYLTYAMFLEPVVRWSLHLRLFKHKSMHYYPLNAFEDLCPLPLSGQAEWFLKQNDFTMFLDATEATTASAIYIALFLFIADKRLEKADL